MTEKYAKFSTALIVQNVLCMVFGYYNGGVGFRGLQAGTESTTPFPHGSGNPEVHGWRIGIRLQINVLSVRLDSLVREGMTALRLSANWREIPEAMTNIVALARSLFVYRSRMTTFV